VVWVPELGAKIENVSRATSLIPDKRAKQYWDPNEHLGTQYGRILGIDRPAWDVYMLFDPQAVWSAKGPPQPYFWMHQLGGVTNAPRLDANEFAMRANQLLNQK